MRCRRTESQRFVVLAVLDLVVLALALSVAGGAAGPDVSSAAREFDLQAERLQTEIDATQQAWQEQDALVRDLLDESRALETSYADPDATAAELRVLEDRYAEALEKAYKQARATIAGRRRVYDQMDKLSELGRRIEAERRAQFDAPMPGGVWRLEVEGSNLIGLLRLEVNGSSVTGTYRMSNGRAGTVSGTYGGGALDLTRYDSGSGRDAVLRAAVDERSQTLAGEWVRFELGAGEPGSGRWSATRLSDQDEVPEL